MVNTAPDLRKVALRAAMRRRRRAMLLAAPDAAREAAARLPLDRLPAHQIVGGYHAVGTEFDPAFVLARLQAHGARLALPVTVDRHGPLVFRLAGDPADFVPDLLGVPSPPMEAPEATPDLLIAPVIAFDNRGGRLGQGGGYFDRTIAALRKRSTIFVIGLALSGQEVARVPREPHDQRLDAILTEKAYMPV